MKFMTTSPIYYHGQYIPAEPNAPLYFAIDKDEVPSNTWKACDEEAAEALKRFANQEVHGVFVDLTVHPIPPEVSRVMKLGKVEEPPRPRGVNTYEPATLSEALQGKRPSDQEPVKRR